MSDKIKKSYIRLSGNSTQPRQAPSSALESTQERLLVTPNDLTTELWSRLQGSWVGMDGFNLIAMPRLGTKPTDLGDFVLAASPYVETLTFSNAGAPARNRGGDEDQFITALEYHQRITANPGADQASLNDDADDAPVHSGELLHVETGMFLNLSQIKDNNHNDLPSPKFNIARSATIPHGNSIMLLGEPPTVADEPPTIDDVSTLPDPSDFRPGYKEPYLLKKPPHFENPNLLLKQHLAKQKKLGLDVIRTIMFSFSSVNSGGILNVPFIKNRADTTFMESTFWLETVRVRGTNQEFDQLQYTQTIGIDFHHFEHGNPKLIGWPHVTVNTLVKQ